MLIYIHTIFVMGQGSVLLLREGGVNGEDYIYINDLFPNVVLHCIDIYAEHLILKIKYLPYHPLPLFYPRFYPHQYSTPRTQRYTG